MTIKVLSLKIIVAVYKVNVISSEYIQSLTTSHFNCFPDRTQRITDFFPKVYVMKVQKGLFSYSICSAYLCKDNILLLLHFKKTFLFLYSKIKIILQVAISQRGVLWNCKDQSIICQSHYLGSGCVQNSSVLYILFYRRPQAHAITSTCDHINIAVSTYSHINIVLCHWFSLSLSLTKSLVGWTPAHQIQLSDSYLPYHNSFFSTYPHPPLYYSDHKKMYYYLIPNVIEIHHISLMAGD